MESNEKCQVEGVSQNPEKRPRKKIMLRQSLLICGLGVLVISSILSFSKDSADRHNERGLAHYKAGETDKAILEFTKAIEKDPKNAKAYYYRGSLYELNNDSNNAIADLTMAVKIRPTYAGAFYRRGAAYYKQGEHDIAIRDFTRAISSKARTCQRLCVPGIDI